MANITQTLLKLKLQQAVTAFVDKGKVLRKSWNCNEDVNNDWEEMMLISNYINVLERHDLSSSLNCLTDANIDSITDHLHSLCEKRKIAYIS